MSVATHHELDLPPIQDLLHIIESGELHIKRDEETGLLAIVAIHSTQRGPSFGGCRCIHYPDLRTAVYDAMRLAKGMSYKSALSNLPLGGGKGVLMLPDEPIDRTAYFEAYGRMVESLNGRYITAMDSGSNMTDMDNIAKHTSYVASKTSDGNPAPATALGTFCGIQAAVKFQLDRDDLEGLTVAIQGAGNVGYGLAKRLHEAGAKLLVADVSQKNVDRCVNEFNAKAIPTSDILTMPCDILAPCALGAILNEDSIPALQTKIIAGAANNQLLESHMGDDIAKRGILFCPDYVVNAGGLIHAASSAGFADGHTPSDIYDTLTMVLERAKAEDLPPNRVAKKIACERIA